MLGEPPGLGGRGARSRRGFGFGVPGCAPVGFTGLEGVGRLAIGIGGPEVVSGRGQGRAARGRGHRGPIAGCVIEVARLLAVVRNDRDHTAQCVISRRFGPRRRGREPEPQDQPKCSPSRRR